jgi:hypothetical protein
LNGDDDDEDDDEDDDDDADDDDDDDDDDSADCGIRKLVILDFNLVSKYNFFFSASLSYLPATVPVLLAERLGGFIFNFTRHIFLFFPQFINDFFLNF